MKYISSHLQTPKIILMLLIFFISIYCFGSEKIVENRISLNFYQTETGLILQTLADHRSEERRVGKECRSRLVQYH